MRDKTLERIEQARVLNDIDKTLQAMTAAINRRGFAEAIDIGESHIQFGPAAPHTAHFWFQLSLAHRLMGHESDADRYWMKAKVRKDYTQTMEGDFLCDVALGYIRDGRTVDAQLLFPRIRTCFSGDLNRVAKLDFVIGRNKAAKGDFMQATTCYQNALHRWEAIGKRADPQWILNCQVHLIRACALDGRRYAVKAVYNQIRSSTPQPNRKQLATIRAARYGGKIGMRLIERLA